MPEEPLIAARYRLLDPLGSGGEAKVFRARDLQDNHDVALRLPIHPQTAIEQPIPPKFHPAWVQLLDAGSDPGRGIYQVFELLEGKTLRQKVALAPLDEKAWLAFVHQSLDAVEALHHAGWVHGDLNADNFLQTSAGWKLLELPFLRLAAPADRSVMFGSIHTLAPEQLEGHPADPQSDLYALGCLFYFGISGEYPHPGTTRQEVAISLLRFPPAPLSEKAPQLSPRTSAWVMGLLQREGRYPSIAEARRLLAIA